MKKIYFQRWVFGKMQDVQTSIEVLDGYNKTKYYRKKNKDEQLLLESAKYAHDSSLCEGYCLCTCELRLVAAENIIEINE